MAIEPPSPDYGVMLLVLFGTAFACLILMIVAAGLLRAASLKEPKPTADEDEGSTRKAA